LLGCLFGSLSLLVVEYAIALHGSRLLANALYLSLPSFLELTDFRAHWHSRVGLAGALARVDGWRHGYGAP
jgi:hypothetical protein